MANVKKSTPRKVSTKRKQGHKLIWFTVIVIAIPMIFVAYVLLTSAVGQDKPVVGNRFGSNDLNPKITQDNLDQIQSALTSIDGVQNAEVTLKSATLRISVDCADDADKIRCNPLPIKAMMRLRVSFLLKRISRIHKIKMERIMTSKLELITLFRKMEIPMDTFILKRPKPVMERRRPMLKLRRKTKM